MAVTQRQVASAAGVTRATVSYVLSGRAKELKITDAVTHRVRRAAKKLGYTPNHAARVLVSGRSMALGLLLGDAAGHVAPFWIARSRSNSALAAASGWPASPARPTMPASPAR
jgi:LacI family transcriptional regulator